MPHNSQTKKDKHTNQAKEIEHLEAKVKRLQAALAAKDAVLSQFASSDNWEYAHCYATIHFGIWRQAWKLEYSPIHIATQALGEGR